MRVWIIGSEATGHAVARALVSALQSLVPNLEFHDGLADNHSWTRVARGDGVLLCVTPSSLLGELLFFDLGRLQGAVGLSGFVAPVLLDLTPEDLAQTPLAMFQCPRAQRDGFEALVAELMRRVDPSLVSDLLAASLVTTWDVLHVLLDDIPGPRLRPLLVTLLLPERPVSFGFDGGSDDASWDDSVGVAIESLAGSPIKPPSFNPRLLVPLDVETSRWFELPRRLSRLQTQHLALISPLLVEQAHGDARALAHQAREEAERFGMYGGAKVMPWKFIKMGGGKLVLLSNVR